MNSKVRAIVFFFASLILMFGLPPLMQAVIMRVDDSELSSLFFNLNNIFFVLLRIVLLVCFFKLTYKSLRKIPLIKSYISLIFTLQFLTIIEISLNIIEPSYDTVEVIYDVLSIFYNFIGLYLLIYSIIVCITKFASVIEKVTILITAISIQLSSHYLIYTLVVHLEEQLPNGGSPMFIATFFLVLSILRLIMYIVQSIQIYNNDKMVRR